MIGVVLLDQKVPWLVLFIRERDKLGQFSYLFLVLLGEVDCVTVHDDVLAKIFVGTEAGGMGW